MKWFTKILCVLSAGEACESVLERAVSIAENQGAELAVVDVIERVVTGIGLPEGGPVSAELQARLVRERLEGLDCLVAPHRERVKLRTDVLIGVPFLEVIREVLRNGHDLVIRAAEHQPLIARLFGSDDMHLLRKCPCPVWLVKCDPLKPYRRILVAVDVDELHPATELETRDALNRRLLELAGTVALGECADLHIAHTWCAPLESHMRSGFVRIDDAKIAAYVEDVRRRREAALGRLIAETVGGKASGAPDCLHLRTHLIQGQARKEIPALAERIEADLVVMGTVGRTGVPGFIVGNTAESILGQIACSVLAVKPPGFVTPVTLEAQG